MLLPGQWLLCDDGVLRPVFRVGIAAADGSMAPVELLADTGADRTVMSAATLARLGLQTLPTPHSLAGVGGVADSVLVDAVIHMHRADGGVAVFRGRFAAFTDLEALDMSVLGRDIINLFALIVDRPRDVVCLVGPGHEYAVTPGP